MVFQIYVLYKFECSPIFNLFFVYYEQLKAGQTSLENELSDLVKFLQSSNPEVQIPFRPHCLKQHISGAFKRNGDKFKHAEIASLMSGTKIKKFNKRLCDSFQLFLKSDKF